jgi:MOSC domain-containing protein YiiM
VTCSKFGEAVAQVCQARQPCNKLAGKNGQKLLPQMDGADRLHGVLRAGAIGRGSGIWVTPSNVSNATKFA